MTKKTRAKARRALLTLSLVLVMMVVAVGGTIAWLTDKTEEVVNTFAPTNIDIELDESDDLDLDMVPGTTITKDPEVTVKAGSEAAWLFVKLDKSANYSTYLEDYEIAEGWTQLKDDDNKDVAGVYYREVTASAANQTFEVLKDNKVTVKEDVTNAQMALIAEESARPTLTITAYAVQKDGVTSAYAAWAKAQDTSNVIYPTTGN